jgi:hypothetical protein
MVFRCEVYFVHLFLLTYIILGSLPAFRTSDFIVLAIKASLREIKCRFYMWLSLNVQFHLNDMYGLQVDYQSSLVNTNDQVNSSCIGT